MHYVVILMTYYNKPLVLIVWNCIKWHPLPLDLVEIIL